MGNEKIGSKYELNCTSIRWAKYFCRMLDKDIISIVNNHEINTIYHHFICSVEYDDPKHVRVSNFSSHFHLRCHKIIRQFFKLFPDDQLDWDDFFQLMLCISCGSKSCTLFLFINSFPEMEFNRLSLVNIKTCSDTLDTVGECTAQVSTYFKRIDTNKDGYITFHQFMSLVGKFNKIYEPLFNFRDELYNTFLPRKAVLRILNRKYNIDDILAYKATHNNQLPPLSCYERMKLFLNGEAHPDSFDYYDDFKRDKSTSMIIPGSGNNTTTPSPVNKGMFNQLSEVDEEKINNTNNNNNNNNNNNTNRTTEDDDIGNNNNNKDGNEDNNKGNANNNSNPDKSSNNNNDENNDNDNDNGKPSEKKSSSYCISTNTIPGSESPVKSSTITPTSLDNPNIVINNNTKLVRFSNNNNNNNNNQSTSNNINNISTSTSNNTHNNRNTIISPTSLNTNNNILPVTSSNHNNLTLNLTGFSLSPTTTLRCKSLLSTPMDINSEISLETLIRQLVRRKNPCKILPNKVAFNVQALSRICKKDDEIEMYYINCFLRNPRYIPNSNINESASFLSQNGFLEHFGSSKLKLSMPSSNNPLLSCNGALLSDRDLLRKTSCDSTKNMKLSLTPPHSILRRTRKNSQHNRNTALSVDRTPSPYKVSLAKSITGTPHGKSTLKKVVYPENNEDSVEST